MTREIHTDFSPEVLEDLARLAETVHFTLTRKGGALALYNKEICITLPDLKGAVISFYRDEPIKGNRYYFIKFGPVTIEDNGRPSYYASLELSPGYCCFKTPIFQGIWENRAD